MTAWYHSFIDAEPDVCGGRAKVCGSRTAVWLVVDLFEQVDRDLDRLRRALPMRSEQELRAALAYYEDHPAEIDADREQNRTAYKDLVSRGWPAPA